MKKYADVKMQEGFKFSSLDKNEKAKLLALIAAGKDEEAARMLIPDMARIFDDEGQAESKARDMVQSLGRWKR